MREGKGDRNFAQIRGLPIFPRIVLSAFFDTGGIY